MLEAVPPSFGLDQPDLPGHVRPRPGILGILARLVVETF